MAGEAMELFCTGCMCSVELYMQGRMHHHSTAWSCPEPACCYDVLLCGQCMTMDGGRELPLARLIDADCQPKRDLPDYRLAAFAQRQPSVQHCHSLVEVALGCAWVCGGCSQEGAGGPRWRCPAGCSIQLCDACVRGVPGDGRTRAPPPPPFAIFVRTLAGRTLHLSVQSHDRVSDLKQKVEETWGCSETEGVPSDRMRLFFAGRQMEDLLTAGDYGIRAGSELHVRVI